MQSCALYSLLGFPRLTPCPHQERYNSIQLPRSSVGPLFSEVDVRFIVYEVLLDEFLTEYAEPNEPWRPIMRLGLGQKGEAYFENGAYKSIELEVQLEVPLLRAPRKKAVIALRAESKDAEAARCKLAKKAYDELRRLDCDGISNTVLLVSPSA